MRAAPAVRVSVTRFGVWQSALGAVVATGWVLIGVWVASHALARAWPAAAPAAVVGGVAVLLSGGLALHLMRVRPFDLAWDGRCWFRSDARGTATDPVAGDLRVAIDFGAWLLLRFVPDPSIRGTGPRWLPVQRSGLAHAWHALRCAVHSPRPGPAEPAGAPAE